jgi:hypothetical protein
VRDDHALDREIAERVERREQAFGIGLVDEHVQPAAGPAQDVAGGERRVLANQEDDLLRLAVEFDRLDAAWQLVDRRRVGTAPPERVPTEYASSL